MQIAGLFAEHEVRLVPDIAVSGDGAQRAGDGDAGPDAVQLEDAAGEVK